MGCAQSSDRKGARGSQAHATTGVREPEQKRSTQSKDIATQSRKLGAYNLCDPLTIPVSLDPNFSKLNVQSKPVAASVGNRDKKILAPHLVVDSTGRCPCLTASGGSPLWSPGLLAR